MSLIVSDGNNRFRILENMSLFLFFMHMTFGKGLEICSKKNL